MMPTASCIQLYTVGAEQMLVSFPISQAEDRKHPHKWNSSYFRKEITCTIWLQKRMFPGETVETICSPLFSTCQVPIPGSTFPQ